MLFGDAIFHGTLHGIRCLDHDKILTLKKNNYVDTVEWE
jgi:hypothetical protein